jgi:hypothetical protein
VNRKIILPEYYCPFAGNSIGGDENYDHDYPPESKKNYDTYVTWTCSKCGMIRSYEVYD